MTWTTNEYNFFKVYRKKPEKKCHGTIKPKLWYWQDLHISGARRYYATHLWISQQHTQSPTGVNYHFGYLHGRELAKHNIYPISAYLASPNLQQKAVTPPTKASPTGDKSLQPQSITQFWINPSVKRLLKKSMV